jgi:predicted ArsR family transcriptional regulator
MLLMDAITPSGTLAEQLAVTPAGIRRHLDALLAEGVVSTHEPRRRVVARGRPAKLYALTDAGHAGQTIGRVASQECQFRIRIAGAIDGNPIAVGDLGRPEQRRLLQSLADVEHPDLDGFIADELKEVPVTTDHHHRVVAFDGS